MSNNFKGKVFSVSSSLFKSNDRRLALKRITEANVAAANALLNASIDVFVAEAVKNMLVDTSMSVASFTALATLIGASPQKVQGLSNVKELGQGLEAVQNKLTSNARPNYTNIEGQTVNEPRSAETGAQLGSQAFDITYASANIGIIDFKFTAVVWQHAALMPKTLESGARAMEQFLEDNTFKYLNPLRILRTVLNI